MLVAGLGSLSGLLRLGGSVLFVSRRQLAMVRGPVVLAHSLWKKLSGFADCIAVVCLWLSLSIRVSLGNIFKDQSFLDVSFGVYSCRSLVV